MNDRMATGYVPDWDIDLAHGEQGQLIALDMLQDIVAGRIRVEVKRDSGFIKSGRLYIETEQNPMRRGIWKPSGISISKAQAWAFLCNNDQGLFIVDSPWLKRAVEEAAKHPSNHAAEKDGDNPTRGICISLNHFGLKRLP